ncbi:cinnamate beta-D-glucosyltransferase-like [Capsicum chacoense]
MPNFLPIKTVGPLLVEDPKVEQDIRGDLVKAGSSITEWLSSKPSSSVVYISFGSIVVPSQEQVDEIVYGLLNSRLNFFSIMKWNSSIEVIANGVHIIAFPQLGDQVTDVKYLVNEFRTGVRLSRGVTENRIIPRCEVEQSLHEVMSGPKAAEMKENLLNWKKKASEAVTEGGSSDQNLQSFINKLMTLQSSNQKLAKLSTSIQLVVTT